jgi:hypothetical protein
MCMTFRLAFYSFGSPRRPSRYSSVFDTFEAGFTDKRRDRLCRIILPSNHKLAILLHDNPLPQEPKFVLNKLRSELSLLIE